MNLTLEIGKKYPEITGPVSDAFAAEINQVCDTGTFDELILDFDGTKVISSMAMGAIFSVYQKLRDRGKRSYIINASDKVKHLLRMVNMADLLLK